MKRLLAILATHIRFVLLFKFPEAVDIKAPFPSPHPEVPPQAASKGEGKDHT
jgi:hypothetical protein